MIANDVVAGLQEKDCFEMEEAVNPGFINLKVKPSFAAAFLNEMAASEKLGVEEMETPKTIMVDYGGPNVAKPLHVGHLRSAIIGESVKRILRYKGNKVIGDIHLGDWGYQMGLIITELQKRKPELPYFDENFTGEYPKEAPFTIGELEEIYPTASAYAKEHEEYREKHCRRRSFAERTSGIPCDLESHYGSFCSRFEEKLCKSERVFRSLEGRGRCPEIYSGYGGDAQRKRICAL